jgi:hypothetical protein
MGLTDGSGRDLIQLKYVHAFCNLVRLFRTAALREAEKRVARPPYRAMV